MNFNKPSKNRFSTVIFYFVIFVLFQLPTSVKAQEKSSPNFTTIKGVIQDQQTKKALEFASITINGTNISTVSNSEGKFVLKVPNNFLSKKITFTYLGYHTKVIDPNDLLKKTIVLKLEPSFEKLPDVSLISKDPKTIIEKTMQNKALNYFEEPVIMKAFYRESIKNRKKYASLAEAVVDIYKSPTTSTSKDEIKLQKSRKSTNYKKVDTLLIKLQGGPHNNLAMDLVKNRDLIFNQNIFDIYDFNFDRIIYLNNKMVYVLRFKQKQSIIEPYFQGKLYIEAETYTLIKSVFNLNLDNLKKASKFFVKKKPAKADVIPISTNYVVDYRKNQGKWYLGYSRIELSFKINWKKKLFNSIYHLTIEMAVTDWQVNTTNTHLKGKEELKSNVIFVDKASGFSDANFWGEYNVIEPDKSIENAIKKIQRNLK